MVGAVRWRATARVIPGGDSGYGAWASAAKCWLAVGNREAGRQGRSAYTLDRNETEPCAGISLNHEPDPPATKYADPVEQDEPIGNVVEAPRHPSLAHPILHPQSTKANRFVVDAPRVMLRAQTVGRPGDALSGRCPSRTRNLAAGTVSFLVTYRRP